MQLASIAEFILQPWGNSAALFQISGHVTRSRTGLHLCYELRGKAAELLLPEPSTTQRRRDGLWRSTCFEFFIAPQGLPQYWEVNLSPSGDWNVYAFADYRAGMREEAAVTALPFTFQQQADCCRLALDFPLAELISPQQPAELAVSAVLHDRNGERSFHALAHCGSQPDFHQRASFLITLPMPA